MMPLLNSLLAMPAQRVIQHVLQGDPFIAARLQQFRGKTLAINCRLPSLQFTLCFEEDGPRLQGIDSESLMLDTDASIAGNALDLMGLLLNDDDRRPLANPALDIGGDASFVNDLYTAIRDLDIDWQDHLGPVLGDVLSHEADRLGRSGLAWSRDVNSSLQRNLADYIKEERRLTPTPLQAETQFRRIQETRLRIDRLQARVFRLQQQRESHDRGTSQ